MHVGIIGGGTMGLTLAYRLAGAGLRVTVFERQAQLGGLATWFNYGPFTWDKFYHVICQSDEHLIGLLRELGINSELNFTQTRTGFLWNGRLLSMSNNWEFLTFPALSPIDKVRLAAGIFYCLRIRNPAPLERESAASWMNRIFGARIYRMIWEPLIQSKYGVLAEQVPAAIMWATIRRYYSTQQRGGRQSFGYLTGGLKTFYDALADAIHSRSGSITCAVPIERLGLDATGRPVIRVKGEERIFDRVVSTIPTAGLRRIAPDFPDLAGPEAKRPRFLGVVCLALILRRTLSPFYITNLIQEGLPFTGIIELSNLAGTASFAGRHFVMLPRYDIPESEWFEMSDETIRTTFLRGLEPFWQDIQHDCEASFVHRERYVQALWIQQPPALKGPRRAVGNRIWNVNSELAGRDTLNNNAIVRVANEAANAFLESLLQEPTEPSQELMREDTPLRITGTG